MSSASSGDSVPEHIVATRRGLPASSRASPSSERPSRAAPLHACCASVRVTMSSNICCGLTSTGRASISSALHLFFASGLYPLPSAARFFGLSRGFASKTASLSSSSSSSSSPPSVAGSFLAWRAGAFLAAGGLAAAGLGLAAGLAAGFFLCDAFFSFGASLDSDSDSDWGESEAEADSSSSLSSSSLSSSSSELTGAARRPRAARPPTRGFSSKSSLETSAAPPLRPEAAAPAAPCAAGDGAALSTRRFLLAVPRVLELLSALPFVSAATGGLFARAFACLATSTISSTFLREYRPGSPSDHSTTYCPSSSSVTRPYCSPEV
mmetsp:Transcript_17462/g.56791  ORF Transcript_17462/g.56791 Transcript_17462/m.56791 type:complete len:323 (+) Transcript_17462:558-1526(+)